MESSYTTFLLLLTISMLSISSATIEPDCGSCSKPKHHTPAVKPPTIVPLPPGILPPVPVPIVPVPPVILPPGTLPPVPVPKLPVPPVTLPPITLPPVTVPNVPLLPPGTVPPALTPPKGTPCAPPAKAATCPIDTLKLGACVDLFGGLVHSVVGDPAVHECCPVLSGLLEIEAALCLCTTLKIKALNLNIYVPIALQVLAICGKTPPPGYTCSI